MGIRFRCENAACRKSLQGKDGAAGKRVKCPGCGQLMLVPADCAASQPASVAPKPPLPVGTKSGMDFPEQPLPKQQAVAIGLSGQDVTREDLKEKARSCPPDGSVPCPICQATLKARNLVRHYDQNHAPPAPLLPTPLAGEKVASAPTPLGNGVTNSAPPAKTTTASITTLLAIAFGTVALAFVITFVAGALAMFLMPIVKSLQEADSTGLKVLIKVPLFAILGILFIGSFLVFNLLPFLVTAAACTNAMDQLRDGSSRTKRVAVGFAVALLSSLLLWVFLPWLQYVPYRAANWSETTLTIYRWVYVVPNLVAGVVIAAKAGSPRKQPAAPQAEPQATPQAAPQAAPERDAV